MRRIQIEKLKEFNRLIVKKKINRTLLPIKEYSIYKKNSQIKICIKYKNHLGNFFSFLISVKVDGNCIVNLKNDKILRYSKNDSINFILKDIESNLIKDIKLPSKEYNYYSDINTSFLYSIIKKEINSFNLTNKQRVTLTRNHTYFKNHLLFVRNDYNFQIGINENCYQLRKFKHKNIIFTKNFRTITELIKGLQEWEN